MKIEKTAKGNIVIKTENDEIEHVIATDVFLHVHKKDEKCVLISKTPTNADNTESIALYSDDISEIDGVAFSGSRNDLLLLLSELFNKGGGNGEGLKQIEQYLNRPIFDGATIYRNIFEAKKEGVAVKVGKPAYNDTTYSSTRWNNELIIQYGGNNETDGNGMLVTMPTDQSVLWLRFLGERWNCVKVYDDEGNQFGLWTAGYRINNTIAPDGGASDSARNTHQWIPINVTGHSGQLYVVPKPLTSGSNWISGIAFSNNPLGLTWLSAVAYYWASNGGDKTAWNSQDWNKDNLGQIAAGTFLNLKVPVVENGEDKLLFINLHGATWNEGGHNAVYVNGSQLDTRLSEHWSNPFFRQRMSNAFNHMFGVKVPAALIPSGATFLTVQFDLRTPNTSVMYFREIGTMNL